MTMQMLLLPQWLTYAWVAVLGAVLVVHVGHAVRVGGETQRWHLTHIVMAAGMIAMYLTPADGDGALDWLGVAVFVAAAVTAARWAIRARTRDGRLNRLWLAAVVDLLVMAYMSLPDADRVAGVSYLLVAYLCVEIALWVVGPTVRRRLAGGATADRLPSVPRTGDIARAGGTALLTRTASGTATAAQHPDRPEHDDALARDTTPAVRATLAVMAASMAWMLIAMQTMHMVATSSMLPGR